MALFIRQSEDRSKLQERLAAELQERNKQRSIREQKPDTIEDSAYLKDTKDASPLTWVWAVIFIAVGAILGYYLYLRTVPQ